MCPSSSKENYFLLWITACKAHKHHFGTEYEEHCHMIKQFVAVIYRVPTCSSRHEPLGMNRGLLYGLQTWLVPKRACSKSLVQKRTRLVHARPVSCLAPGCPFWMAQTCVPIRGPLGAGSGFEYHGGTAAYSAPEMLLPLRSRPVKSAQPGAHKYRRQLTALHTEWSLWRC
jgi:hypothetical protein